MFIIID